MELVASNFLHGHFIENGSQCQMVLFSRRQMILKNVSCECISKVTCRDIKINDSHRIRL